MKNVLVLSSSPREGGNSDLLCDAFAKGAIKETKFLDKAYKMGLKVK